MGRKGGGIGARPKRKPIEWGEKERGKRRWRGMWDETNSKLREWDETIPEEGGTNLERDI